MGMSASQARLIALTARMSDTEYEAQQINQQRLTLSNKMNEIYEVLCNMEVPTPPSKIDYMKTQYSGKSGNTHYSVKVGDDGAIKASERTEGDIVTKSGAQQVTAPANPEQYINLASKVDAKSLEKKNASDYYKVIDEKSKPETDRSGFAEGYKEYVSGTVKEHYLEKVVDKEAYTDKDNKYHEEEYHYVDKTKDVSISNMLISEFEEKYKNSQERVTATNSDNTVVTVDKFSGFEGVKTDHIYGLKTVSNSEDFDKNYEYKNDNETISGSDAIKFNKEIDDKLKKNYAVKDGNTYKIVSGEDLLNNGETGFEINNETKLIETIDAIKQGASGLCVGGNATMSLEDAEKKFGPTGQNLESFNAAFQGLRNIFPDSYTDFTVILSPSGDNGYKFSFCMTEDLKKSLDTDGLTSVWVPGQGEYDKELANFKEEDIMFDETTGDISSLNVDGKPIKLTSERVVDEYEYEAAMNKYNNEKAVYDQEQNRLNKQTSIYQRQDKQLELKLTRLDTERNALNTELEAVKKVVQDAIDKGFKTFSG